MGEGGGGPAVTAVTLRAQQVRTTLVGCAGAVALSAAVSSAWISNGLLTISADEPARTLDAAGWSRDPISLGGAVWLPLHRVLLGTALRVHGDLFLTPRVVTVLLGCAAVALAGWLAFELFGRPAVAILAAFLVALSPDRVVLGTVPLAEPLFLVGFMASAAFMARFLRLGRPRDVWFAALSVCIASLVRYEGWMVAVVMAGALVLGAATGRVQLPWRTVAGVVGLLGSVPILWLVYSRIHEGSFWVYVDHYRSFVVTDPGLDTRVRESALGEMFSAMVPLGVIGLLAAAWAAARSTLVRRWLVVPIASLVLLTVVELAGSYIGTYSPWRTAMPWAAVLAPCVAGAIVHVCDRLRWRHALALGGALAVAALGAWSVIAVGAIESKASLGDRRAGRALETAMAASDGPVDVIIEGDDYRDLDVRAGASSLDHLRGFSECRVSSVPLGRPTPLRCRQIGPPAEGTRIVVVRDRATASALERRLGRASVRRVGAWSIFVMGPV